jgi:hypothetical protein
MLGYEHTTIEGRQAHLHQTEQPNDLPTSCRCPGYNLDNTLLSATYTAGSGIASTPTVSFTYDPVYNRVASMTDGTGTIHYYYNTVYRSGSAITGGGKLNDVTVPIASSTATVTYVSYDALGRVTNRTIDRGPDLHLRVRRRQRAAGEHEIPLDRYPWERT